MLWENLIAKNKGLYSLMCLSKCVHVGAYVGGMCAVKGLCRNAWSWGYLRVSGLSWSLDRSTQFHFSEKKDDIQHKKEKKNTKVAGK